MVVVLDLVVSPRMLVVRNTKMNQILIPSMIELIVSSSFDHTSEKIDD